MTSGTMEEIMATRSMHTNIIRDGVSFSFVSKSNTCGVILYDRFSGNMLQRIPFEQQERTGNLYVKKVTDVNAYDITYQFYEDDKIIPDPHAELFVGRYLYGAARQEKDLRAAFCGAFFDWGEDVCPKIPYQDSIVYCLHVRGFTKHPSSKVSNKGTFLGVIEKIPYLKEIGITTVEFQPIYEFFELPTMEERQQSLPYPVAEKDLDQLQPVRLNYWGYKKGYYYTPKGAYAAGEDSSVEFKRLVRSFHENNMEVILQMYFPAEMPGYEMLDILRYWVMEYHVDGFHLMGDGVQSVDLFVEDPILAGIKLWWYRFDKMPDEKCLAIYQDDYMYSMRKFLKGDENMVDSAMFHMRYNPERCGRIHYFSNYYGLTMHDMVAYGRKHNEDNGEENRDGNDYNCSWNCGVEGPSRKKAVVALRKKQIQNAIAMLLLGQSVPLIFMGDEFGNSQRGNNNPYCQDNGISWLNWKDLDRNKEIFDFWKTMVDFRKIHPILHMEREPRVMDYAACGYPDLSYHGENAWRPQREIYSRCFGMMYCGKYAKRNRNEEDDFLYIALNMYWENVEFGMPKLPENTRWKPVVWTQQDIVPMTAKEEEGMDYKFIVPPRSIIVFASETVTKPSKKMRKPKKKERD